MAEYFAEFCGEPTNLKPMSQNKHSEAYVTAIKALNELFRDAIGSGLALATDPRSEKDKKERQIQDFPNAHAAAEVLDLAIRAAAMFERMFDVCPNGVKSIIGPHTVIPVRAPCARGPRKKKPSPATKRADMIRDLKPFMGTALPSKPGASTDDQFSELLFAILQWRRADENFEPKTVPKLPDLSVETLGEWADAMRDLALSVRQPGFEKTLCSEARSGLERAEGTNKTKKETRKRGKGEQKERKFLKEKSVSLKNGTEIDAMQALRLRSAGWEIEDRRDGNQLRHFVRGVGPIEVTPSTATPSKLRERFKAWLKTRVPKRPSA